MAKKTSGTEATVVEGAVADMDPQERRKRAARKDVEQVALALERAKAQAAKAEAQVKYAEERLTQAQAALDALGG